VGVNGKENGGGKKAAGEKIFEYDSIEDLSRDDTLQMERNKLIIPIVHVPPCNS